MLPLFVILFRLTDSKQKTVESYTYDSFGKIRLHKGNKSRNTFTYTGRQYDRETGLYYYRNRYYDPKIGRFLTQDPLGTVDGYNLYTYVKNNPVNFMDPFGLASIRSRPLEGWSYEIGQLRHEQIFFDDGKDLEGRPAKNYNIGFFNDNTIRPDKQENLNKYSHTIYSGLDDDLMREAVLKVKNQWSLQYLLFGNQCQDFVKTVKQEYERLGGVEIKEK